MKVNISKAKDLLRQGELIATPTDTVYGIAADMYNEAAILKLYNLKKRPVHKPMVIQLSSYSQIADFLSLIPYDLEKLMHRFWPGALTLVLPIKEGKVPALLRAHLPTAAFRISAHKNLRSLIDEYGPLVITSANYTGQKELLNEKEIEKEFGVQFPILESHDSEVFGIASTILAYIDSSWVILRKGHIYLKDLRQILGYDPPVVSHVDFANKNYTISPQLYLMDCPYDGSIKVVMGFDDREYMGAEHKISLGNLSNPMHAKKMIVDAMQTISKAGYAHIWVDMNFPKEGSLKTLAEILERAVRFEG